MGFDVGTGLLINAGSNLVVGGLNTWQQHKNLNYQKDLQNRIFAREDTSVQRRVADLKAAGLSPVLAAGQGANAGPVVSTSAPQFNAGDFSNALQVMQMENTKAQIDVANADITKTNAEKAYIDQQRAKAYQDTVKQKIENDYSAKTGIPANVSGPAKVLRDAVPALDNFRKSVERAAPVEDAYKVPFGSYKYGFPVEDAYKVPFGSYKYGYK